MHKGQDKVNIVEVYHATTCMLGYKHNDILELWVSLNGGSRCRLNEDPGNGLVPYACL